MLFPSLPRALPLLLLAAGGFCAAQTPPPALPPMILQMLEETSPAPHRMLTGEVNIPRYAPWILERSLSLNSWAPMAEGWGHEAAPDYHDLLFYGSTVSTTRDGFSLNLQSFPALPPAPSPVAGVGPLVPFHSAQLALTWRGDGWVIAEWRSGGNAGGGGSLVRARFQPTGPDAFSLSNPAAPARQPWGVGAITGSRLDAWPIFLSFMVMSDPAPTTPVPAPSSFAVGSDDAKIRAFLLARQAEVRQQIWPPENFGPPEPLSPVTQQQRSFFQLRASAIDFNRDGIPNNIPIGIANAWRSRKSHPQRSLLPPLCGFRRGADRRRACGLGENLQPHQHHPQHLRLLAVRQALSLHFLRQLHRNPPPAASLLPPRSRSQRHRLLHHRRKGAPPPLRSLKPGGMDRALQSQGQRRARVSP